MCFNELHIEFDAEGNPYLGEEADELSHLKTPEDECSDHDDCWCAHDAELPVESRPEEAYRAIVAEMSEETRALLEDGSADITDDVTSSGRKDRDAARSD